ncbi:MAG: nucleoside recognition protein [Clostridiales bacterium]|nr:nucleoside recognition protein [Clostridiales bacterium]
MDWSRVFIETFESRYSTILRITLIVIPLLILIECLKDIGWLEKIAAHSHGITKFLGLPGESAIGLIVGLFTGIVFGSGVIMQIQQEAQMTKTQMNVLFLFIGICHGIIEETAVFTAVGANGFILFTSRLAAAVVFTFAYMWIMRAVDRSAAKDGMDAD